MHVPVDKVITVASQWPMELWGVDCSQSVAHGAVGCGLQPVSGPWSCGVWIAASQWPMELWGVDCSQSVAHGAMGCS